VWTMQQLVEQWLANQTMRGYSNRTIERRRWSMGKLIEHLSGRLIDCTGPELEDWLATYTTTQTRYSLRADTHQFFIWAIRREHATTDPTLYVDPPRLRKRLPTPVPTEQIGQLLTASEGHERLMIMLAAYAGLRVSEIAALNGSDIADGCIRVRDGKGGKDRAVPVSPELDLAIAQPQSGPMFPQCGDGQAVSARIRKNMRRLDIQHRPHDLRHSFGTELARNGVPIQIIAQLMGHESLTTTKGYILLAAPDRTLVAGLYRLPAA
jgi:site-specific recombinase XerD